mgnify:CR=1 FL=1
MEFSSNTALARYLIHKLVADGQVHNRSDITDYVFEESKKYELKGPMTRTIIFGAFQILCYNNKYTMVKRGYYKLNDIQLNETLTPYKKAHRILEDARERVKSCFVVTLSDSDLDVEALKPVIQRAKTMDKLLNSTIQEAEKGQREMEEMEQQELEGSMQMNL